MKGSRALGVAASFLLGGGLLWLLLPLADLGQVRAVVRQVRPADVLLALALYAAAYWLRALRIALADARTGASLGGLFRLVSIQNLLGYLLPFRSGELSFVYLLRRRFEVPLARGTGIWAAVRIIDALACGTVLGIAALILLVGEGRRAIDPRVATVLVVAGFVAAAGLLLLGVLGSRVGRIGRSLRAEPGSPEGWSGRLRAGCAEGMETLATCFEGRNRLWLPVVSLSIWLALYGFFAVTLRISGIAGVDFPRVVVGSSGAVATHFLPINAPAGVGTLEAGWVLGFTIVGLDPADAMLSGIVMHGWLLVFAGALGIGAAVVGAWSGERF